jgi:hypothetical protein
MTIPIRPEVLVNAALNLVLRRRAHAARAGAADDRSCATSRLAQHLVRGM